MSSEFSFFDSSTNSSYFHDTDAVAMNSLTPSDLEYCNVTSSFDDVDDDNGGGLFHNLQLLDQHCNQWSNYNNSSSSMDDNAHRRQMGIQEEAEMNGDDHDDQRTTVDGPAHEQCEREEPRTSTKRRSMSTLSHHLRRPSDIIARGRELGIVDRYPEFEGLEDPDTRHWTRVSGPDGSNHEEVTIETRTRSEGTTMGTFPNMFSSLKYEIIHCITGSICDKYPRLYYRITAVDSESGEEIKKDMGRRMVIKGDTEGEMKSKRRLPQTRNMMMTTTATTTTNARRSSRIGTQSKSKSGDVRLSSSPSQSHHRLTATSRIQFTTVSFHFGKKKFCLQISYYASRDTQDCKPIMVMRSADFDVFARRVSGVLYQLEQKILEVENRNKPQKRKQLDAEQADAESKQSHPSKKKKWTTMKPHNKRELIESEQQRVTLEDYMELLDKLLKTKNLLAPHERDIAHQRTMERLSESASLEGSQLPDVSPSAQTQNMENLYLQLAELSNSLPIVASTLPSSDNNNINDNNAFLEYPWDSLDDKRDNHHRTDLGT